MTRKSNPLIVIFPFLFIREVEGFDLGIGTLKPAYKENIEKENKEIQTHLKKIQELFKIQGNKIVFWSYINTKISSRKDWERISRELNTFITLLRFTNLKDERERANFRHFNYFAFQITEENKPFEKFSYYKGILNGENEFNFYIRNHIAHNPFTTSDLEPLPISKEVIDKDKTLGLFNFLPNTEQNKFLKAISWFNRSFSHQGMGLDYSESVLNMQTALEALLRPADEERGIKAQIKTALFTLLGHDRELSLWIDKFYELRNSIVHGSDKPISFLYIHPDSKTGLGHRHHLTMARKVFLNSLESILTIREDFKISDIRRDLISNEKRVNESINILKNGKTNIDKLSSKGLFDKISSLQKDDISAPKKKVKELGEMFLPIIKNELKPEFPSETACIETIDKIINWSGTNFGELALIYSDLQEKYEPIYFGTSSHIKLALRGSAYHFIDYCTWRLLTFWGDSDK